MRLDAQTGHLQLVEGAHRVVGYYSDDDLAWLRARVTEARDNSGSVAAEQIIGWAYEASRVQALVETARSEGYLLGIARMLAAKHTFYSAGEVRAALVGDKAASDARVAVVVEWAFGKAVRERFKATERPHVYDGALLAMYAIAQATKRRITLPPRILGELARLQAEEKAARTVKRAHLTLAKPIASVLSGPAGIGAVPALAEVARAVKLDGALTNPVERERLINALRTLARRRDAVGACAKALLERAGAPLTDPATKRTPTRAQSARRSKAQKARVVG